MASPRERTTVTTDWDRLRAVNEGMPRDVIPFPIKPTSSQSGRKHPDPLILLPFAEVIQPGRMVTHINGPPGFHRLEFRGEVG